MQSLDLTVSYKAILLGTLFKQVLGGIWYGPLFGGPFVRLQFGKDMKAFHEEMKGKKMNMGPLYLGAAVCSLVYNIVLAHILAAAPTQFNATYGHALTTSFWLWLGMTAATSFPNQVLFSDKSWKLWALHRGYDLLSSFASAALLHYFQK